MPGWDKLRPQLAARILWLGSALVFGVSASPAQSNGSDVIHYSQIVEKATPIVQWTTPSAISYGTALGPLQLSATANVPGSFAYSPGAGIVLNSGTSTLSATFTPADSANFNSVTTTVSIQVNKAQATVSLLNLQQPFTGHPLEPTVTTLPAGLNVTLTYNGGTTTPTAPGTYAVVATVSDANYVGSTSATFVILGSSPAIILSSNTPVMLVGNPVTLVATLSSSTGSPTGQVSFQDGSTVLGTATAVSGQATLTTSSLPLGAQSVTAIYSGDGSTATATSSPLAVTIIDYSVTSSSGTQTVTAGKSVTYPVSIVPTSGSMIPLPATMTITGFPAKISVSASPAQWMAGANGTWTLPANSQLANIAVTITDPPLGTAHRNPGVSNARITELALMMLTAPLLGRLRRARKQMPRMMLLCVLTVSAAFALLGLNGCIASYGFVRTLPTTSVITVTVSAGTLSHSTTLNLTVE